MPQPEPFAAGLRSTRNEVDPPPGAKVEPALRHGNAHRARPTGTKGGLSPRHEAFAVGFRTRLDWGIVEEHKRARTRHRCGRRARDRSRTADSLIAIVGKDHGTEAHDGDDKRRSRETRPGRNVWKHRNHPRGPGRE